METFLRQLVPLIPVIAGAVIALAGGWIKHWVERREQRSHRRREKLERLLERVYSLKPWTDSLDQRLAFGTSDIEIASPIEDIEVISNLYFHGLKPEIDAIVHAASNYSAEMHRLSADRLTNKRVAPDAGSTIQEHYVPRTRAIRALTDKARVISKQLA
jgi:hypothetical protein